MAAALPSLAAVLAHTMAASAASAAPPKGQWLIRADSNIVSGHHQSDPAVWIAGRHVASWDACRRLCAANTTSCREFDYAATYNKGHINPSTGKASGTCGAAGTCYFRSDDLWGLGPGSGCNHTAGRRPGLPPPPTPSPPRPRPTPYPPTPPPPPPGPPPIPHPPLGYQPNIVFILTDDQDTRLSGLSDTYSDIGSMEAMPSLRKHMVDGGVRMANGFVATPICCPSRTETFTGRYLHNVFPTSSASANCMHADTALAGAYRTGMFGRLTDLGYDVGLFGKVISSSKSGQLGCRSHIAPLAP